MPLDLDLDVALPVEEVIDRILAMPTGDDHSRSAELVDPLGQLAPGSLAGEHLGLHQVRGDDGRQREQPFHEHFHRIVLQQLGAGARDHHRIDHERHPVGSEKVGDDVDELTREEHSRLRGVDSDVREDRHQLRLDERRGQFLHSAHPERILRRQRDDRARAEAAGGGERLEVRLDPCAAPRIGAGNRETSWNCQFTPFAGITRIRFSGCVLSLANEAPR
jgi:hypothetical protein